MTKKPTSTWPLVLGFAIELGTLIIYLMWVHATHGELTLTNVFTSAAELPVMVDAALTAGYLYVGASEPWATTLGSLTSSALSVVVGIMFFIYFRNLWREHKAAKAAP